jgi:group I intron endonuclease
MTAKSQYSVPGIYKITNIVSGKAYVGGTDNVQKRWTKHKWLLCLGLHKLKALQEDWNKEGANKFEFNIVLQLPKLPKAEFKLLKTEKETEVLAATPNNYNRTIGAGDFGFRLSNDTKKELSKFNKKKWDNPEYKKRLSEIHMKKWADGEYKRKATKETREKQSLAKKLYYEKTGGMKEETKEKLSRIHQARIARAKTKEPS